MSKALGALLKTLQKSPWPRPTSVAPRLNPSELVEEENTPWYDSRSFYPARTGDILVGRYQIATKVGHGSGSTVWLARDLKQWKWCADRFVAIKIKANVPSAAHEAAHGEQGILEHISRPQSRHQGSTFVRQLLDSFTIPGQSGAHMCLVFEPLREPLWIYQRRFKGDVIPVELVKIILQMTLHGLDYLHSECGVVHTDLKPDNIMVKLENDSILERDAQAEFLDPLPQKHCADGRIIYLARNDYGPLQKLVGNIRITDFDLAVLGSTIHRGCIQAAIYRAPEVILDSGYSYPADIWSLGVMLWDLIGGKPLFRPNNGSQSHTYAENAHLGMIMALIGKAPHSLLREGNRTALFFDAKGQLHTPQLVPSSFTFEETLLNVSDFNVSDEEKSMFIDFVQKMIRWDPKERATARQLLEDPWLYSDFDAR